MEIGDVAASAGALAGVRRTMIQYIKHMMVVADLARGDAGAIEDALEVAWKLQRKAD